MNLDLIKSLSLSAFCAVATGCVNYDIATQQKVSFYSEDTPAVTVSVNGQVVGETTCSTVLDRSNSYVVMFTKDGYEPAKYDLVPFTDPDTGVVAFVDEVYCPELSPASEEPVPAEPATAVAVADVEEPPVDEPVVEPETVVEPSEDAVPAVVLGEEIDAEPEVVAEESDDAVPAVVLEDEVVADAVPADAEPAVEPEVAPEEPVAESDEAVAEDVVDAEPVVEPEVAPEEPVAEPETVAEDVVDAEPVVEPEVAPEEPVAEPEAAAEDIPAESDEAVAEDVADAEPVVEPDVVPAEPAEVEAPAKQLRTMSELRAELTELKRQRKLNLISAEEFDKRMAALAEEVSQTY